MLENHTIGLILPCYNEEEGLEVMLPKVPKFVDEIIIVNNNSTDDTVKIAQSYNCTILNEKIKGYGAAYKCGFKYNNNDIMVTMDADDTYPIEEIEENIKFLLLNKLDFINCSRFPLKNQDSMHKSNIIGNKILTIESKLLFQIELKDSQSGMWIIRRNVFDHIFPKSKGMPLSQEIKLLAIKNKQIKFAETHITYKPRVGEVKLNKWQDGFDNMMHMLKIRFKS